MKTKIWKQKHFKHEKDALLFMSKTPNIELISVNYSIDSDVIVTYYVLYITVDLIKETIVEAYNYADDTGIAKEDLDTYINFLNKKLNLGISENTWAEDFCKLIDIVVSATHDEYPC